MNLVDVRGDALRHARNGGILIATSSHNDLVGGENADLGGDFEGTGIVSPQSGNRHPFVNGWLEGTGVRLDVGDNLVLHHKSVWIGSGIRMTGQLALPVGCDQTKSLPSL